METEQLTNRGPRGCRRLLIGCGVVTALIIAGFAALLIYTLRMPSARELLRCRDDMIAVGDALRRYEDVNGSYPPDLQALEKDYLKDPSVLRCPLDKSPSSQTSYIYHRPGPNAKGDFVVLECCRHRIRGDVPVSRLLILKDGTFNIETPSLQQQVKEMERRKDGGASARPLTEKAGHRRSASSGGCCRYRSRASPA